MQLLHEFTVPVDVDETWAFLTDIERIALCTPGAELLEVDAARHRPTALFATRPQDVWAIAGIGPLSGEQQMALEPAPTGARSR